MKDLIESVFKVFDRKQKRRLLYVAVMILINSAVSLLGVGVLLPFIQAIMNPEQLLSNEYVRWFYDLFSFSDTSQLVIALAVAIMFVYVAKNGFIIYMNNLLYCLPTMESRKCRTA